MTNNIGKIISGAVILIFLFSSLSFAGEGKSDSWVQGTKFSGDIRLRYQYEKKTDAEDRYRSRVRFRYVFERKVNDRINVGFGLASGSADPTSTNQTFEDMFSSKAIWIDKAYLELIPISNFSLIGGKMKNPFYCTELIWDSDITPEGLDMRAKYNALSSIGILLNLGAFPVDEYKDIPEDPVLFGVQADMNVLDKKIRAGVACYDFYNMKGKAVEDVSPYYIKKTNTLRKDDNAGKNYFEYAYRLLDIIIELNPLDTPLPLRFYGDFVKNIADEVQKDTGWLAGVRIGPIKDFRNLQLSYCYRKIEADAVPAVLNDSDFHGGGTDNKGHKIEFRCGFFDKTSFGATYSNTQGLAENGKQNRFQVDFIVEF